MYSKIDLLTFRKKMKQFRSHSWSISGLDTLYAYLIDGEEPDTIGCELDVVAICCTYTEYSDLDEVMAEYTDYSTLEQIQEMTAIFPVRGTSHWIVQDM